MLIIKITDGNIEKALKKLKHKTRNTKLVETLREREYFEKPSVKKRSEKLNAIYKQKKNTIEDNDI